MTNSSPEDAPLDPAVERVQARLRRLILISGLTLGVGILAVFGAILYRIVTIDASVAPAPPAEAVAATLTHDDLGLPPGAELNDTAIFGGRLVLTYTHEGGHTLVFLDAARLTVTGRLDLPRPGTR